jgi:hypothetical protein
MNEPHETPAEYAARFDREWAAVVEPIISEMEAANGIQPADDPDDPEELVNIEEEMRLSRQRRRAG